MFMVVVVIWHSTNMKQSMLLPLFLSTAPTTITKISFVILRLNYYVMSTSDSIELLCVVLILVILIPPTFFFRKNHMLWNDMFDTVYCSFYVSVCINNATPANTHLLAGVSVDIFKVLKNTKVFPRAEVLYTGHS